MRFHRSHIQLISSQVSCIPEELSVRWSKKRRFDLVWDIVKRLSPSRLLRNERIESSEQDCSVNDKKRFKALFGSGYHADHGSAEVPHNTASTLEYSKAPIIIVDSLCTDTSTKLIQQAYEGLQKGEHLTCLFKYLDR